MNNPTTLFHGKPTGDFAKDLQFSRNTQHLIDKVYSTVWKNSNIKRSSAFTNNCCNSDADAFDKYFAIDSVVTRANGSSITIQEKVLRHKYSDFNTFTIEYMQNRHAGTLGEFAHCGSHLYLHSYANSDCTQLSKWFLLRTFEFHEWFTNYLQQLKSNGYSTLAYMSSHTRNVTTSNASMLFIDYNDIPESVIYKSYKNVSVIWA